MRYTWHIIVALTVAAMSIACESDYSFRGTADTIHFSADTLSFDTVFAGRISATARLMVYNTSSDDMTIDRISLDGGKASDFNININGRDLTDVDGIRLRSGDSLYIFVNIFPGSNAETYRVCEDQITVRAASNTWTARLWACCLTAIERTGHISASQTWTADTPYLISDTLTVDTTAVLTMEAGTRIYMDDNAQINVYGRIVAQGEADNMIRISTARTSSFYNDIPGQWKSIMLMADCGEAEMHYTEIANATNAILADSATTVLLTDVEIRDASKRAVAAYDANLTMTNCVLYNCGSSLLNIYGGLTEIGHCTLSNNFRWKTRNEASVVVRSGNDATEMKHFSMTNSVVVGNQTNELEADDTLTPETFAVSHCYIRTDKTWADDDPRLDNVTMGKQPYFANDKAFDFRPAADSPLVDAANAEYAASIPTDHDGNTRTDTPDIGAYELTTDNKE